MTDAATRAEAGTILRSLIDKIMLTPKGGTKELSVDLVGDLAGILSIATNSGRLAIQSELPKLQPVNETDDDGVAGAKETSHLAGSVAMVAGTRILREETPTRAIRSRTVSGHETRYNGEAAKERRYIRDSWGAEAVVAGTGFEPVTFRL